MNQKSLSLWLKIMIAGVFICGLFVCAVVLPIIGQNINLYYEREFEYAFWPCLIFLWICALPCFAALIIGWRIADNIGRGNAFSIQNAKLFKVISILAAADSAFFFLGNLVLVLCRMSHISTIILSLIVSLVGVAIAVAAAVLSHLVAKAASMQAENDLTI